VLPICDQGSIVISPKKFLTGNEAEAALMRTSKLLLQGIALHSIEGDPNEYSRFRYRLEDVERGLEQAASVSELVAGAGAALDALADHNRCTTQFLRQQAMEFQAMVKMLTATISAISAAGDSNALQLCAIEKEVEAATRIEGVREIKARLGGCLEGIRKETERQRQEAARTAEDLMKSMEEARSILDLSEGPDPVTGLPPRHIAEKVFAQACREDKRAFALVVLVDRIQVLNNRFGHDVGDEIMRHFTDFLQTQLSSPDRLFRWTGPALAGLLYRSSRIERVRDEVRRILETRCEYTVRTSSRTILLPISLRWALFPLVSSPRLLTQNLENFISSKNPND
jgi:diguanylate cyclase (GGDEF)-like protein